MGLVTKRKMVAAVTDPLSVICNLVAVSGSTAQFYDQDIQEYVSDRSLVPLVLMPQIGVSDPTGQMASQPEITSVTWYEGTPKSDKSNQIKTSTADGYEISTETTATDSYKLNTKNLLADTDFPAIDSDTMTAGTQELLAAVDESGAPFNWLRMAGTGEYTGYITYAELTGGQTYTFSFYYYYEEKVNYGFQAQLTAYYSSDNKDSGYNIPINGTGSNYKFLADNGRLVRRESFTFTMPSARNYLKLCVVLRSSGSVLCLSRPLLTSGSSLQNWAVKQSGGFPLHALKVTRNVPVDSPVDIYAVAAFTDSRTGDACYVTSHRLLNTAYQQLHVYSLRLGNAPAVARFDPLLATAEEDGSWPQTYTMQLMDGKNPVEDDHAAYWWQVKGSDGTWRDFTDTEKVTLLTSGLNSDGTWQKSITVDMRYAEEFTFRCRAAYYETTRPTSPTDSRLVQMVTRKVQMAQKLTAECVQLYGAKVAADLATEVKFTCDTRSGSRLFNASDYDSLFQFAWYAKSAKAGSTATLLGSTREVAFTPSALGFDPKYAVSVWCEVGLYKVHDAATGKKLFA